MNGAIVGIIVGAIVVVIIVVIIIIIVCSKKKKKDIKIDDEPSPIFEDEQKEKFN